MALQILASLQVGIRIVFVKLHVNIMYVGPMEAKRVRFRTSVRYSHSDARRLGRGAAELLPRRAYAAARGP